MSLPGCLHHHIHRIFFDQTTPLRCMKYWFTSVLVFMTVHDNEDICISSSSVHIPCLHIDLVWSRWGKETKWTCLMKNIFFHYCNSCELCFIEVTYVLRICLLKWIKYDLSLKCAVSLCLHQSGVDEVCDKKRSKWNTYFFPSFSSSWLVLKCSRKVFNFDEKLILHLYIDRLKKWQIQAITVWFLKSIIDFAV